MVPVCGDESQDLIQLKIFLLAADRQVVEDQVNQIDPPETETPHIFRPLITNGAQEQVEPEEEQIRSKGEVKRSRGEVKEEFVCTCLQTSWTPADTAYRPRGTTADTWNTAASSGTTYSQKKISVKWHCTPWWCHSVCVCVIVRSYSPGPPQ